MGSLQLRSSGRLRLRYFDQTRNLDQTVGLESVPLSVGPVYRIGIYQQKGTGGNAILAAYLAEGDAPFGAPFAVTTIGNWTVPVDRLRIGATTGVALDATIDDIMLDRAAMPLPSIDTPPPSTPPTPTGTQTPTTTPTPTPPVSAGPTVSIADHAFQPKAITINVNDTVTWIQDDDVPHNITEKGGTWRSPTLTKGGTFTLTFITAGTYNYYCSFHANMDGTIMVIGAPSTTPTITPADTRWIVSLPLVVR